MSKETGFIMSESDIACKKRVISSISNLYKKPTNDIESVVTYWNNKLYLKNQNLHFDTTSFVKLDKKHIQAKSDALKEYKSQGVRDYMSEEFIFSLAKTRGVQIGTQCAESFEVIRLVI